MSHPSFLQQTLDGKTTLGLPYSLPGGVRVQVMDEGVIRFEPNDGDTRRLDLVISCGVHGNETGPVELVDRLIAALYAGELRPRARVLFVFGNVDALRSGTRYMAQDMNRLFCRIPDVSDDQEARRATMLEMQLMRFFARAMQDDKPRLHYDLHTAIHGSLIEKFAIYPLPPIGKSFEPTEIARLAEAGIEAVLLQSTTSTTFSFFSSRHCDATAFTVELGRAMPFGHNQGVDLSGMESYLSRLIEGEVPQPDLVPESTQVFRVAREIVKESPAFKLHIDAKTDNFMPLPQGMLLAEDGEKRWTITEEQARIIFPNPDVAVGQRAGLIIVPSRSYSRH
ncbi:Succinylglutamate desuccinylase [Andreprevotia sp. IGB-42]|uniref:succinylglutamate desuccinylase n=1 Tax=Andreprevotia sp. IGB-42 TaxID=2497473 RepID=UPI001359FD14|nr:succinylglutamate desuccinylase [Andreprevotia sp. IGB-42]KAF0813232.1 Succinylglutamate desuccinylase [Andreprevotia sp. IGB-42]